MVVPLRIELRITGPKPAVLPLHYGTIKNAEAMGIEPILTANKAAVLPINDKILYYRGLKT